jgi:guanylate kinase
MENKLARLQEFQDILAEYHISSAGKTILVDTTLVLLVGPSSSGRNTIINALVDTGHYHQIVSDTTRHPRTNNGIPEQDGVEYWFRTEQEVLTELREGKFLEAAIIHDQQVSGISLRELAKAQEKDLVAVNEIETIGAHNIIVAKPDAFVFFIVPPSFAVWMERMDGRGTLSPAEKQRRLKSSLTEFEDALTNDYYIYIVNEDFHHSVERIHRRVVEGEHDPLHQEHGRAVIEKLLVETQAHINA